MTAPAATAVTFAGGIKHSGTIYQGQPLSAIGGGLVGPGGGLIKGQSPQVLAATGGAAIDASLGSHCTLTPTATETLTISGGSYLQLLVIDVLTSGTSSFTITFGTGFKPTGTLATGTADAKVFSLIFLCDAAGTFQEIARTAAK